VGKRYSRVKIREIYLNKTQNLGIQTNVMNTETKFTEQGILENLNSFLKKNKENEKDICMEVLYNHLENLNKNNFDDGNIDIDIDVNNLQRWIIYLILLIRLRK
jgi:hypothetical protein